MNLSKYFIIGWILLIIVLVSLYAKLDIPVKELKLKYAPPPSKFIEINNMEVHFRSEGNTSDTLPLVLLHGTGASLHTFDDWATSLIPIKKVIRLDLPGFGLTGPFPDGNYKISAYINFLDEFLEKLNIKSCILGGNSLGGNLAWHYVLAHPEKVEKLILIDAAGLKYTEKKPPLAFKIARIPVLNKILTLITPKSVVKKSLEDVYSDKSLVNEALVDRYYDLALREGNRQAMVDRLTNPNDYSAIPDLQKIEIPALILWGENDLLIPVSVASEFSKLIANDTMVIIKNCGHVPMEECPTESLEAVFKFISN